MKEREEVARSRLFSTSEDGQGSFFPTPCLMYGRWSILACPSPMDERKIPLPVYEDAKQRMMATESSVNHYAYVEESDQRKGMRIRKHV